MIRAFALACLAVTVAQGTPLAQERRLPGGIMAVDGRPAPELRLADMDGQSLDLKRLRGRWTFVHFWASWCGPCREEMPAIQRMAESLAETPLHLVLVNTAETEDTVFNFMGIVAPGLSTLMDTDGLVTEQWQPRGLPASFLVDPAGRIRYMALGGRPWDEQAYLDFLHSLPSD